MSTKQTAAQTLAALQAQLAAKRGIAPTTTSGLPEWVGAKLADAKAAATGGDSWFTRARLGYAQRTLELMD